MDGPTERSVATGRITLSVREREGGSPTILALHGLASNARWWDLVGARLAPAHGVVAVDLRGHGGSDRPDQGYDFDSITADLQGLCQTLDLREVVVVGHSWGASAALAFAATEPQRCLACVCVDGGATDLRAYFGGSWDEAAIRMRPPQLSGVTEASIRGWVRNGPLGGRFAAAAEEIMLGNFETDGDGGLRPRLHVDRHMQIAYHLFHVDYQALMARLRCPVLIIPAGDPTAPPEAKRAAVANAVTVLGSRGQVVWIDGVHDLPVQRPDEVADAISHFVKGVGDPT